MALDREPKIGDRVKIVHASFGWASVKSGDIGEIIGIEDYRNEKKYLIETPAFRGILDGWSDKRKDFCLVGKCEDEFDGPETTKEPKLNLYYDPYGRKTHAVLMQAHRDRDRESNNPAVQAVKTIMQRFCYADHKNPRTDDASYEPVWVQREP